MLLAQSNRKASRLQLHYSPQAAMADKKRHILSVDAQFSMTKHLGVRIYRCKVCAAASKGIEQARDHALTHTESARLEVEEYKNTICSRCGDDFKKPQWLRSHMAQNLRCAQRKEAHERYCMGCEDRPA